jgi:hypothetical protein
LRACESATDADAAATMTAQMVTRTLRSRSSTSGDGVMSTSSRDVDMAR